MLRGWIRMIDSIAIISKEVFVLPERLLKLVNIGEYFICIIIVLN